MSDYDGNEVPEERILVDIRREMVNHSRFARVMGGGIRLPKSLVSGQG